LKRVNSAKVSSIRFDHIFDLLGRVDIRAHLLTIRVA